MIPVNHMYIPEITSAIRLSISDFFLRPYIILQYNRLWSFYNRCIFLII